MNNDSERRAALGGAGTKGWNGKRTAYRCADDVSVPVSVGALRRGRLD